MDIVLKYGEIILRSFAIYILVTLVIRFFGQKELGDLSVQDIILVMLLADVIGHSIIAGDDNVWAGIIAFFTIFLTNKLLNHLSFKSPKFRDKFESDPIVVIQNSKINERSLEKLKLTKEELHEMLREQGHLNPDIFYQILLTY